MGLFNLPHTINVNLHNRATDEVAMRLTECLVLLKTTYQEVKQMAHDIADFKTKFGEMKTEITRIATTLADALERLQNGGLDSTQEEEVFADATATVEELKQIGQTPQP